MRFGRSSTAAIAATQSTSPANRVMHALFALTAVVVAVPPLYLIKSALGINLLPGPSPLHNLLYWMVQ